MFYRGIMLFLTASLLAQDFRGAPGKVLYRRGLPFMKRGPAYNSALLQEIFDHLVWRLARGNFFMSFRVMSLVTISNGNGSIGEPKLRNERHHHTKYKIWFTATVIMLGKNSYQRYKLSERPYNRTVYAKFLNGFLNRYYNLYIVMHWKYVHLFKYLFSKT